MTREIRLLAISSDLPSQFEELRREAGEAGYRFLDRLGEDWETTRMRFDAPGEVLLTAHVRDDLAGIGGLTVDPDLSGAMRMRRFYVAKKFRRQGVGRTLAEALLDGAKGTTEVVTVNVGPKEAYPFWEAVGFQPVAADGHTHELRLAGDSR